MFTTWVTDGDKGGVKLAGEFPQEEPVTAVSPSFLEIILTEFWFIHILLRNYFQIPRYPLSWV
jgi:hypothetical protein